jgi:hypothetical protein
MDIIESSVTAPNQGQLIGLGVRCLLTVELANCWSERMGVKMTQRREKGEAGDYKNGQMGGWARVESRAVRND